MKEILSTKNTLIKELKKLQQKKQREAQQKYLIEGFHLVEEAAAAQATIEWLIFNDRGQKEWGTWLTQQDQEKLIFVSDEVLQSLSELPTPQGILAVVQMPSSANTTIEKGNWLLLDNVQDPGNVGTMIRTADAAGLKGVILGEGTADIYNGKVLRAMQGSNYHITVLRQSLEKALPNLRANQATILGTALDERAQVYTETTLTGNYALIMGNEGQGVQANLLAQTDANLYLPMRGQAESLNVAVAAGILMYSFA